MYLTVDTVLKKILSGWEKDGVHVSAETYTEDTVPAGWTPVWTHHLIILYRYDYPHPASYMLVTRAKVPGDFYIYRDVDGRLKETKNIVTQLGRAVSDDITLSIAIDDDSFVYVINGNTTTVSNRRNSNFSGKYKIRKQLRRNRRYEIQWYRRRRGRNAWDTAAFSNAMRNGKGRQVAFIEARSVGRFEDGYISYARWSPYAIPTRSGIVRIRKRATEGAPAGRWNYFIVRDLDAGVNEAVRVTKIREDVKRFGFVKRQ